MLGGNYGEQKAQPMKSLLGMRGTEEGIVEEDRFSRDAFLSHQG